MNQESPALARSILMLFAVASGLSVANIYYAQPLLDSMARDLGISAASIGLVVTFAQIGYALGLFFLVPLGDLVNRRRLIITQLLLSVCALLIVAISTNYLVLFIGMMGVGLFAVVVQVLVAFAATLAPPSERGRAVGVVTSGIVLGILLARTVAGFLTDLAGWRSVYFISATLTLMMGILLSFILPKNQATTNSTYGELLKSTFSLFIEEPLLRLRALYAFLIFASFSTLWTPLVLHLSSPPFQFSHSLIGLFGLVGVAGALGATRAGHWADIGKGHWTTGAGLFLLLVSWGIMSVFKIWALIIGIIVLDFAVQAVHVTNQSFIFPLRPDARSRLVAVYMIFYSLGSGIGSISSTSVFASYGWSGVCLLGAAYSIFALIVWIVKQVELKPLKEPV